MYQQKKTWILAPTEDASPAGPIALGNIIKHYAFPDEACNEERPPPIDAALETSRSDVDNFEVDVKEGNSVGGGLFAQFLQMLAGGLANGDVSFQRDTTSSSDYRIDRLEKHWFKPNLAYIEEAIKSPGVQQQLQATYFNHSLYMITGIAIARGASKLRKDIIDNGLHVQVGVDLTALTGAPVTLGPKGSWSNKKEVSVSCGRMSDFIIAYRLTKFKVDKKGKIAKEDYTKGALFSRTEETKDASKPPGSDAYTVDLNEVSSQDLPREEAIVVQDEDGEDCECIRLRP